MTETKFISEQEYVKSFTDRGLSVPPFLVFQPYVIWDGVPGYLVPVADDEKQEVDRALDKR